MHMFGTMRFRGLIPTDMEIDPVDQDRRGAQTEAVRDSGRTPDPETEQRILRAFRAALRP